MESGIMSTPTMRQTSSTKSTSSFVKDLTADDRAAHAALLKDRYGLPAVMAEDDGRDDTNWNNW